jgi:hypothetical protein
MKAEVGIADRPAIEERFVWWLWQTRRFDGALARGAGHDVVFPGWFSTGAGPDFRDALIAGRDSGLRQGDVEIHVDESDWRAHGHDRDHAYDDVILHVVLRSNAMCPAITASGRMVPVLELEALLPATVEELSAACGNWRPAIVRCPAHMDGSSDLLRTVEQSGARRFEEKVRRVVADLDALGRDEALYRLLAQCLGFSANRRAFRRVAEALPFELLASLTTFQIEQLLFSAAGLATQDGLLTAYVEGPVLEPGELVTFRVRPGNSPATRLRGLARLVATHRQGIAAAVEAQPVEDLWKLFVVESDRVLVGRSRADDIVINVALPYLTAYADLDGTAALARLAAPADNRWVKSLRAHLAGSGLTIRPYRALHQQGLLDLSLRFCRYDHCEACPLHAAGGHRSGILE